MRKALLLAVLVLSTLSTLAQTPAAEMPSVTLPPALDRVLRDYERNWQARDAAGLAKLFTEDGFVLSNGKPAVRGRAAIEKAYSGQGGPLSLRAYAYSTDGKVGYIVGAYSSAKDKPDDGKFVLALRKGKDGRWLIAADIDNTIRRPTPPPAP